MEGCVACLGADICNVCDSGSGYVLNDGKCSLRFKGITKLN